MADPVDSLRYGKQEHLYHFDSANSLWYKALREKNLNKSFLRRRSE